MARQKGSANFAGTLEVLAGGPIDARTVVPALADLTASDSFPYPYVGMEVYVVAENKKYRLIASDPTASDNWEEVGSGGGGGHTIYDDGTAMADRAGLDMVDFDLTDNSTDDTTEVRPHRLTSADMSEIMSTLPAAPVEGVVYSTTEQVIGKWIDSKPLYQITLSGIVNNNSWLSIPSNIIVISANGYGQESGGSAIPLSYYYSASNWFSYWIDYNNNRMGFNMTEHSNVNVIITLQYTKTTD